VHSCPREGTQNSSEGECREDEAKAAGTQGRLAPRLALISASSHFEDRQMGNWTLLNRQVNRGLPWAGGHGIRGPLGGCFIRNGKGPWTTRATIKQLREGGQGGGGGRHRSG